MIMNFFLICTIIQDMIDTLRLGEENMLNQSNKRSKK